VIRGNEGDETPAWFSYSHTEESGRRQRTALAKGGSGSDVRRWKTPRMGRKAVIGLVGMLGSKAFSGKNE
jgi:hypothetical protein